MSPPLSSIQKNAQPLTQAQLKQLLIMRAMLKKHQATQTIPPVSSNTYAVPQHKTTYTLPKYHGLKKWAFFTWMDQKIHKKYAPRKYYYDARLTEPLQQLINHMARTNNIRYDVPVVMDNDLKYNASANKHNQITVKKGLLQKEKTPAEVAFFMAHELSHVANKDIKRREWPKRLLMGGTFALFLGGWTSMLQLAQVNKIKSTTLKLGIGIAIPLVVIGGLFKYLGSATRRLEDEADARAVVILRNAGISLKGIESFKESIIKVTRKPPKNLKERLQKIWKAFIHNHSHADIRMQTIHSMAEQTKQQASDTPAFTNAQWNAIKAVVTPSIFPPRDFRKMLQLSPPPSLKKSGLNNPEKRSFK